METSKRRVLKPSSSRVSNPILLYPIRPDSKITGACTLIQPKEAALSEGFREVRL